MNIKRNCLILAPHEDDEIILCGSFINRLKHKNYQIYIVFMTNGDYEVEIGQIRLKEALEVMKLYKIPESNIIFMGYANEYDTQDPHIYNAPAGLIVHSQYGNTETYGLNEHREYCFLKHGMHHEYTRENIYTDLYEILDEIRPELIFATGEEVHPDHIANSLFLDEVLGRIMQEDKTYRPTVLKKPEYHTAWFGPADLKEDNNASASFDYRHPRIVVNSYPSWFYDPFLRWGDRIRIPIDRNAKYNVKMALKKYESQRAIDHYDMLLNSDVVFWQRRTDSITYASKITVSSGDESFLNDFKRNDSLDIRRKSVEVWEQNASIWHPEENDDEPAICIEFDEQYTIDKIVIYQEYNPKSAITDCGVIVKGYGEIWRGKLRRYKETEIKFSAVNTSEVKIRIYQCSDKMCDIGITEIEVYPICYPQNKLIKLMVDNEFVYDYKVVPNIRQKLSVYVVNDIGESCIQSADNFHVDIIDETGEIIPKENIFDKNWNIITNAFNDRYVCVKAIEDSNLSDQIKIYFPKIERQGKIFFIGTPNHWNSGDHFISQATINFLNAIFPDRDIYEIQINEFEQELPRLIKEIRYCDLIVLQGGGNMGNVYPTNENIRRKVISLFRYNHIVVFPETIYYEETAKGYYEKLASQKIYSDAKYLTICAREKESYNQMKILYPNNTILLVPDIVCSMDMGIVPGKPTMGVSLFFRSDGEKAISDNLRVSIIEELQRRELSYKYCDMIYNHNRGYCGKANRQVIIRSKLIEIKRSNLVITDRLHAMILCVMTGTPCLVFCGYNHKIPSTYETWFENIPYVRLISEQDNIANAIDEIIEKRERNERIMEAFKEYFQDLIFVLMEGLDCE